MYNSEYRKVTNEKGKKRGIPIPVWKEKVRLHILYVFFHEYLENVFCCCKYKVCTVLNI